MIPEDRIGDLISKELQNKLSDPERAELSAWINESETNRLWHSEVFNRQQTFANIGVYVDGLAAQDRMRSNIEKQIEFSDQKQRGKVVYFFRPYLRIVAAILLAMIAGIWGFYLYHKTSVAPIADIPPGSDKALLIENGHSIPLDSAKEGVVASEAGGVNVQKTKQGTIQMTINPGSSEMRREITYNTIVTPRGGQYQIVLSDGSKIWLNAGSSLRFPSSFSGEDRRVTLTGEGYFEIASNPHIPFIVNARGAEVQVLGTHFNIAAYDDSLSDNSVTTTLLDGKVKVSSGSIAQVLEPNQEAVLHIDGTMKVINDQEPNAKIDWVSGLFQFENEDLRSVMAKLARWYNVDVEYDPHAPFQYTFQGVIERSDKLSAVLKMLRRTGGVNFQVDNANRKIIVLP
jgi:transmembrane sensor